MLRSKAGKEHKEIKTHKSFLDWFTTLSELGLLTPDLKRRDPVTYDAMDWHFKSMVYINGVHGWPIASKYNTKMMARWDNIQVNEFASSSHVVNGDWGLALHRDTLMDLLMAKKSGNVKSGSSSSSGYTQSGTAQREDPTDTYCANHKKYYAAAFDHTTKSCRKKAPGS
jgi:hypothetical protein